MSNFHKQSGKTQPTSSCAPPVWLMWRQWGKGLCGLLAGPPQKLVCTGSHWLPLSCTGAGQTGTEPQPLWAAGVAGSCLGVLRSGSGWCYLGWSGSGAGPLCLHLLSLGHGLGPGPLLRQAWGPGPAERLLLLPLLGGRGCASSCVSLDMSPGVGERHRHRRHDDGKKKKIIKFIKSIQIMQWSI